MLTVRRASRATREGASVQRTGFRSAVVASPPWTTSRAASSACSSPVCPSTRTSSARPTTTRSTPSSTRCWCQSPYDVRGDDLPSPSTRRLSTSVLNGKPTTPSGGSATRSSRGSSRSSSLARTGTSRRARRRRRACRGHSRMRRKPTPSNGAREAFLGRWRSTQVLRADRASYATNSGIVLRGKFTTIRVFIPVSLPRTSRHSSGSLAGLLTEASPGGDVVAMNPDLARNAVLAFLRGQPVGPCACRGSLLVALVGPVSWTVICEACRGSLDVDAPMDRRDRTRWFPAPGDRCPFDATRLDVNPIREAMQPERTNYSCRWCGAETLIP